MERENNIQNGHNKKLRWQHKETMVLRKNKITEERYRTLCTTNVNLGLMQAKKNFIKTYESTKEIFS